MSWANWGIVTGLVLLVANLLLSMSLLHSDGKEPDETSSLSPAGPVDRDTQEPPIRQKAA